jgi:hypothetical protein
MRVQGVCREKSGGELFGAHAGGRAHHAERDGYKGRSKLRGVITASSEAHHAERDGYKVCRSGGEARRAERNGYKKRGASSAARLRR